MSDPASVMQSLSNSMCRHCSHRVTRVIIPNDYADYGITIDENDITSNSCVVLEHHICMELDVDLDCDVLECNRFKENIGGSGRPSLLKGDLP